MNREFGVGDHVYLRVRENKSSLKTRSCAKLSPRYYGPFEVLERIGPIAYKLALPASTRAHNVFHVSLLKKYVHDPNHVIQVEPEGDFQIEPMHILDRKVTMLRNRAIGQVKVQWEHYGPEEATWELEDAMRLAHPFFFSILQSTEDSANEGRGEFNTLVLTPWY